MSLSSSEDIGKEIFEWKNDKFKCYNATKHYRYACFQNQENKFISSMRFNDKMLAWAANENSKKRFKSKIKFMDFTILIKMVKKNINKYKKDKNYKSINLKISWPNWFKKNKIIFKKAHGWKYSYNFKSSNLDSYWDKKFKIGICGDWFQGPKAENAWASAISLFKK